MRFPIIAFKNNIVFSLQGEAFAIYRLKGEAYNYLPRAQRLENLNALIKDADAAVLAGALMAAP